MGKVLKKELRQQHKELFRVAVRAAYRTSRRMSAIRMERLPATWRQKIKVFHGATRVLYDI